MAKSNFKRDYDNGTVTLPSGQVVNVLDLPASSVNYFSVYGFIRACQDPTGGEKVESKKLAAQLEIAENLIAGTHDKKARTFGENLEDKLEEAEGKLKVFMAADNAMKLFMAGLGITKSTMEAEIAKVAKAIKKRDEKRAKVKEGLEKIDKALAGEEEEEIDILGDDTLDGSE